MKLKTKHAQAIRELIVSVNANDEQTVQAIVLDQSICLHEAIFLVAAASADFQVDCEAFSRLVFSASNSAWANRESMAKRINAGGIDDVIKDLAGHERPLACCLVILVCDWLPTVADKFVSKMEYLHANPDLMNV